MAQTTVQGPDADHLGPNLTDETPEKGWSFKRILATINTMFTELYSSVGTLETLVTGLTAPELGYIDGVTPGDPATANKALVAGADAKVGAVTFDGAITQDVVGLTTADIGAKNGATVAAVENGDPVLHKTVLTLTATPITLTDDPGVGQYGGVKLYDMPAGNIVIFGAVLDAALTLIETWWKDAAEGDVGLGSAVPADGGALATTKQNIIPTTAIAAMTAQAGPIDAQSTAAMISQAAGAADLDVNLNIRIDDDAGHMPDVVTNGAFGADTDWTKGVGWTIGAGVADSDGSQVAASDLSQVLAGLLEGVTYKVTCTITRSAGSIQPHLGGTAGTARSSANTFTENIVAGPGGSIVFRADADFVGTLDDVSITPLTGTGTITGTLTLLWANAGDLA